MNRSNINFKFNAASASFTEVAQHLKALKGGFPGLFADIKISQLKLDSGAVNILTSACRVIHEVITAYQKNPNAPIYLGLGETHNNPAHQIHHMLVLKGLIHEGFDITLGVEQYENTFLEHLKRQLTVQGNSDDIDQLIKTYIDINPNVITTHRLLEFKTKNAPYTQKILEHYVAQLQRHITSFLTDAPKDDTHILTDKLPPDHEYHNHKEAISLEEKLGMEIRNKDSLETLFQKHHQHTAMNTSGRKEAVVDTGGNAHFYDHTESKSKNKLAMIAEKYPGLIAIGHSCYSLPKHNSAIPKNLLITDNLPSNEFEYEKLFANKIFTQILPKPNATNWNWGKFVRNPGSYYNEYRLERDPLEEHIYYVNTRLNVLGLGDVIPDDPIGTYNEYRNDWEINIIALKAYINQGLRDLELKREQERVRSQQAKQMTPC